MSHNIAKTALLVTAAVTLSGCAQMVTSVIACGVTQNQRLILLPVLSQSFCDPRLSKTMFLKARRNPSKLSKRHLLKTATADKDIMHRAIRHKPSRAES